MAPELLCEHIINHSIITTHQSILMPALIIDSLGDNPSIGPRQAAPSWDSGDDLILMASESRGWFSEGCRVQEDETQS